MAKILVFGTEGAQIESSSFIGDSGRAKSRTLRTQQPWRHLYSPKATVVRHMTQLSLHTNDARHKAVSHMTQLTSRHA
ncbi:hypothetical protein TNCV_2553131 [Trichonephila clavipes]|nr:hypothetical protein TNCV_2553131 [Trichonephila clavipes]